MKLKDKKIDIQGVQYVTDKYGNHKKETVTIATVWAYFRQLSGNEIYKVTTQVTEEVMFVINYSNFPQPNRTENKVHQGLCRK